ncbi:conserved hypothetical protein [Rhodospirillaceae bacterium LM-1]|nr:conserved hypothetical protein [Rhodospirillaceae bacterium LM-1]
MIITCPACSARFNVADHLIGTTGRSVRCAKCGHKWHQMPEGMEGMAPPPAPPAPPTPKRPAPVAQPAPRPAPMKGQMPSPLPKLGDIPLEMPAQGHVPLPSMDGAEDDVDLSAALDRVAGVVAQADAQHAFESVGSKKSSGGESSGQDLPDDFDFGDAEPIPEVFSKASSPAKQPGKRGLFGGLIILLAFILFLGGLAAGAYFLRSQIVELWPDAAVFYEELGIEAEALGSGLKFRNVTSERVMENNVEILVVRGVIANVSDKTRDLPLVKLSLYDSANLVVQEKIMPPPERTLAANEIAGFKVNVESPAAAARRFEVTFAPRPGQE